MNEEREKIELSILSPTLGPVKVEMQILKPFQYEKMEWKSNIEFERPCRWIGPDGTEWYRPKYGNMIFNIRWTIKK